MFDRVVVDLRRSPAERWAFLEERHAADARALSDFYLRDLGPLEELAPLILPIAQTHLEPSIQEELRALSSMLGITEERLYLANLYYDAFRVLLGCTGIAVDDPGGPWHARNLDWWSPVRLLATTTWIVRFEGGSWGPFEVVGWPGFVGAFSGVAEKRFAVSMNAVASREPPALAASVPMLIRKALEEARDFDAAVSLLSSTPVTADCLLLVTGPRAGELVVIERTSTRAVLRSAEDGLLVVTNDYRAMPDQLATSTGELARTADGRYARAHELLCAGPPRDADSALALLSDPRVRMDMTVQQMVFRARTGLLAMRDPRRP